MAKPLANLLLVIPLFVGVQAAPAAVLTSSFNQHRLRLDRQVDEYSFLVGGHLYGTGLNQDSVFPSPSLLANIERINDSGASLFMALGDIFRRADSVHIDTFLRSFALKLHMPLFNAVGNHDVLSGRAMYTSRFGPTYFDFVYQHELFVVLDTGLTPNRISGDQLDFFRAILQRAQQDTLIERIFIFSHQPVWSESNPDKLVRTYSDIPNYNRELRPLLLPLARQKQVIWFSDDIGGADDPLSLFFHQDSTANLTFVATGLGDTKNDVLIEVAVSHKKGVTLVPFSLSGHAFEPLEQYGVAHWQNYPAIGQRDWQDKFSRLIYNRLFRFGALCGGGVAVILAVVYFVIFSRPQK